MAKFLFLQNPVDFWLWQRFFSFGQFLLDLPFRHFSHHNYCFPGSERKTRGKSYEKCYTFHFVAWLGRREVPGFFRTCLLLKPKQLLGKGKEREKPKETIACTFLLGSLELEVYPLITSIPPFSLVDKEQSRKHCGLPSTSYVTL